MSREIDERVVAMYFDNTKFNRNAEQTLGIIDKLKQSIKMEGAEEGFKNVEEASKKLDFQHVRDSAKKLKESFSSFGDAIKKSVSISTAPLRKLKGLFDELGHYVAKVVGFDVASKIVNSVESAIRSLTIAPISSGWRQYENTMDSIKTIMSSTGESIDVVNGKLAEMTTYANKTIYSLNDMTSNLGKFTNNGVQLDDATNAMIGLANATADAGQGSQQASMAMYNVSQAMGVGKMTTIDWKSLENANIATIKLKRTFMDSGVAAGTLEKRVTGINEKGEEIVEYWTKANNGMKAQQVTAENFRDSLQSGWLSKDAMLKTFLIYSGQLSEAEIMALGFSREEAVRLKAIGEEALKAAQEVRTFSKLMDSLRESVQSSWSETFELIFGDMLEGTNFWTRLNEKLDGILQKGAEARNNILMTWRGLIRDENGNVKRIQDMYEAEMTFAQRDYNAGYINETELLQRQAEIEEKYGDRTLWADYGEVAKDTFLDIIDIIAEFIDMVKTAWGNVFGGITGVGLRDFTQRFRDLIDRVKAWLGSLDDAGSRINKIRRALETVFRVIKVGVVIIKTLAGIVIKFLKPFIEPLLEAIGFIGDLFNIDGANNLGESLKMLGDNFSNLWNKLVNLGWEGIFVKIGDWVSGLWIQIRDGISGWLSDNGLDGVVQWFVSVGDKIKAGVEEIRKAWEDSGVGPFFRRMWDTIVGWFSPEVTHEYIEGGGGWREMYGDTPIVKFLKRIWADVEGYWNQFINFPIWGAIGNFFTNIWNSVVGWFSPSVSHTYIEGGGGWREMYGDSPIVKFLKHIWENLQSYWTDFTGLSIWNDIGEFFTNLWDDISGLFNPTLSIQSRGPFDNGFMSFANQFELVEGDAPIVKFFKDLYEGVKEWWENIKDWWTHSDIKEIADNAIKEVASWFQPVVNDKGEVVGDAPIVTFFVNLWHGLENAWNSLKDAWNGSGIKSFLQGIWTDIVNMFNPVVESQFLPSGERREVKHDAPIVQFFKDLLQGLKDAWDAIVGWEGWGYIASFLSDTWTWLLGLINGDSEAIGDAEVADNVAAIKDKDWFGKVGDFVKGVNSVEEVPEKKKSFIERLFSWIGDLFNSIKDWMTQVGITDIGAKMLDGLAKLIEAFAAVFQHVATLINHFATGKHNLGDWIELLGVLGGILTFKHLTKDMGVGMSSLGTTILQIAAAMALIAFGIKELSKLDLGDLAKGVGAMTVVGAIIGVICYVIFRIQSTVQTHSLTRYPSTPMERVLSRLILAIGAMGLIGIIFEKLPNVISAMSEAKKYSGLNGEDVAYVLLGIAGAVAGILLALSIVQRIVPEGIDPAATFKTLVSGLEVVAAVLVALIGSDGILEAIKGAVSAIWGTDAFDKAVEDAIAFAQSLGRLLGAFIGGIIRGIKNEKTDKEVLDETQELTEDMAAFLENFDVSSLGKITRFVEYMSALSGYIAEIKKSDFTGFADASAEFANGIASFLTNVILNEDMASILSSADDLNHLSILFATIEQMGSAFNALQTGIGYDGTAFLRFTNFSDFINQGAQSQREGWVSLDQFVDDLHTFLEKVSTVGEGINFDGFLIVEKLFEVVSLALADTTELPTFDGRPIVDAIADAILQHESILTSAIHTMVQNALDAMDPARIKAGEFSMDNLVDLVLPQEVGKVVDFVKNVAESPVVQIGGKIIRAISPARNTLQIGVNKWIEQAVGLDKLGKSVEFNPVNAENLANKDFSESYKDYEQYLTPNMEGYFTELYGPNSPIKKMMTSFGIQTNDAAIEGYWNEAKNQFGSSNNELMNKIWSGEGGDLTELTLPITPVLRVDKFNEDWEGFRSKLTEVPMEMNAMVVFGEQTIPIDDTRILSEMQNIRTEITVSRNAMENAIANVNGTLGSKLDSLDANISNLRLVLDTGAVVGGLVSGLDAALYNRGMVSGITGVVPGGT